MRVVDVVSGLGPVHIQGDSAAGFNQLRSDSRSFTAGDFFVAIRGTQFDGHQFVREACLGGAAAVAVEDPKFVPPDYKGVVVTTPDTRRAWALMAAAFFGKPGDKLFMVGVTGTNGKTTTASMIEAVLNRGGLPCGLIGTIDYRFGGRVWPSTHTTPDPIDLHKLFSEWVNEKARAVSMEVSSHALAMSRVDGIQFDAAVFTNLTRDHLDYHGTMEGYLHAKARLFHELLESSTKKSKRAIINHDDPHAQKMRPPHVPVWTYGLSDGDLRADGLRLSFEGTEFTAVTPLGSVGVRLNMIGAHNVMNALAALGVALHAGVNAREAAAALAALSGVKGRLQRVPSKSPVRAFVDYAHSDDALVNVLGFLKRLRDETSPQARVTTVFGCGGDRDKGKRPLMLAAALKYSDKVVVTSDNPRTEDPLLIIEDILGHRKQSELPENVIVQVDRAKAIEVALREARAGDVVLIAGKGHEDYQIIGKTKHPFDDLKVAKEILDS